MKYNLLSNISDRVNFEQDAAREIPTSMLSKKNAALRVKAKHAIRVLLMEDDHANMEVKDHS